jgi:hypothetical protein
MPRPDVPEDYTGPRLSDDGKVTAEFIEELIEYQRTEKRLHRKFAAMVCFACGSREHVC